MLVKEQNIVLVVDDDIENREMLQLYLRKFDFIVHCAKNGEKALKNLDAIKPDIILLDVIMSGMSGFEVSRQIKKLDKSKDIPIIFMSSSHDNENKIKGFELDAVDYITKPFRLNEVVARIKKHLTIYNLQKQLEEQNYKLQKEIEERKQIEINLKQSEDQFKGAFESATHGMSIVGLDGRFLEINQAFSNIVGYSIFELQAICFQTITHHDDLNEDMVNIRRLIAGDMKSYKMEKRYLHKNGDIVWVLLSVALVRNEMGKPDHFISQVIDITANKKAEKCLRESEAQKLAILNGITKSIIFVDKNQKILWANKAAAKFVNKNVQELIGNKCSEIFANPVEPYIKCPTIKVLKTKKSEKSILYFNENKIWDKRSEPVFDDNGDILGIVVIIQDITELMKSESDLKEAKEKAEESDRLKSAFLANLSHEIRTPMNSIIGFSQMLCNKNMSEKQRNNFKNIINDSGQKLLRVINDIIDISKIEAGQIEIINFNISINDLIDEMFSVYKTIADRNNLTFNSSKTLSKFQCNISIDGDKLKQVIDNLLSNAFKFTRKGGVLIGYDLVGDNLHFYVRDTGIGIEEKYHKMIFERFKQAKLKSTETLFGGTGLGLAISKAFIEKMGGEIWITSEINKGSTFRFTLPYNTTETNYPMQTNIRSFIY